MKYGGLLVKLTMGVALVLGVCGNNLEAVENVSEYTGKYQPVTTRLAVPKAQRQESYMNMNSEEAESKEVITKENVSKDGMLTAAIAYPTGRISTSSLLIEKIYPSTVRLGTPYEYIIKVTNLTDLDLQGVNIMEKIPEGFQLTDAAPKISSRTNGEANWSLGNLKPNQTVTIKVNGQVNSKGELPCCTSAKYDNPALCSTSQLITPNITVALNAPAQVTTCDRIPLEYTVTNSGDSLLTDVVVNAALPEGVTTTSGETSISLRAGNLAAGESRKINAYTQAKNPGAYSFTGNATSRDASAVAAAKSTEVVQPSLKVSASVDKENVYSGRPLIYTFNVTNDGDTSTEATVLQAKLNSGAQAKSASDGGKISGNNISWNLGSLKPGVSKTVTVNAEAAAIGTASAQVSANATCAEVMDATAQSLVQGIPALLLEVVDLVDPIEVNGAETYLITVTNQGTANATNIEVNSTFEGMNYISDSGATRGSVTGNSLSFATLPTLAPKQKAQWNIKVSGKTAGDLRFKVSLDSDELTRSVEETESTYVY